MGVPVHRLGLQEFVDWENEQPGRNEFYRGEVFAMTGGRRTHGTVVANLIRHLGNALAGSPCRAFSESMKLQIGDEAVLYPDVFVTCDASDLATDTIFRSPVLVIEVLSPSTQSYDRSLKFALYRKLESLREYVLIDPETRRIDAFRRGSDGRWDIHDLSADAHVGFPTLGITLDLPAIFDGVTPAGSDLTK